MKLNGFSMSILEGKEQENGYVVMQHNTQYRIKLNNNTKARCDVEVHIDDELVGKWRLHRGSNIVLERPLDDDGKFTFYELGTAEAKDAQIKKNAHTGLITAIFKPEKSRPTPRPFPRNLASEQHDDATDFDSIPPYWLEFSSAGADDREVPVSSPPLDFADSLSSGLSDFDAGGTGLSGKSDQTFFRVPALDYDPEKEVTIHLRLVAEKRKARPLGKRSTPIPPPVHHL